MKKFPWFPIVVIVLAFAKANTLQAQQQVKGIATYKSLTKFNLPKDTTMQKQAESDPMIRQIMEQLEKGNTSEYQLFFTPQESYYSKMVELAKPEAKKMGISVSVSAGDGIGATIYKDIAKGRYLKEGNIMGKDFLIEDALETYAWQLQSESKKIGQYTCYKAIYKPVKKEKEQSEQEKAKKEDAPKGLLASMPERDNTLTAWYTPDIAISNGPGEYHGLPGLILEINTVDTTILCTSIEMNPAKGFELKKPKGGKAVTQKEFDTINEKKMNELKQRQGSNGGFIFQSFGN